MRHALLFLGLSLFASGCYLRHDGPGGPGCGGTTCGLGNVCCATCDGTGRCQTADLPCPDVICTDDCTSSVDCGPRQFCALPVGTCGGIGACTPLPGTCPGDCPGVCGCDGLDYCNSCAANSSGVNVASPSPCGGEVCGGRICPAGSTCCPLCFGEVDCIGTPDGLCPDIFCPADCVINEECGPSEYCAFAPGECGPSRVPGRCEPRPDGCMDDCPGTCGCDGAIYCNDCFAAQSGVNVDGRPDACGPMPCGRGGEICGDGEYCDLGADCGAGDLHRCRRLPATCPDIDAPVCGCDGRTYGNNCEARAAGMTVAATGACPMPEFFPSCLAMLRATPGLASGVYTIAPDGVPIPIYCDMVTDGGGWTLVASSRGTTLDDAAGEWHGDLTVSTPMGSSTTVWRGMRSVIGRRGDVRFTCRVSFDPAERVDLSFYEVHWYDEWTLGSDADSCFNESDGAGYDRPAPRRRDNLAGVEIPLGVDWGAGFLEGEDGCGDDGDFTVDLRDRGMDSDEMDGTDWGEDDSSPKCGFGAIMDGVWQIWAREP